MTLAQPVPTVQIAAVVLVTRLEHRLVDALQALADQTRRADALVILDASPRGEVADRLAESADFRATLPTLTIERVDADDRAWADPAAAAQQALRLAADRQPEAGAWWVLTGECVPATDALEQLAILLDRDPSAAQVAPKLSDAERPGRLRRFGIQVTRSGRLQLAPRPGTPDQQQFDDRQDALAAPVLGSLIRAAAYADLQGQSHRFGALGNDLDLGWRAHLAGHRVLLAPRARVAVPPRVLRAPSPADRRDARRVALARRPLLLTPALAAWIAASSLAVALGLLLLKRPAAASRSARDLGALLDPWRPIAARWSSRKERRVRAATLRGLFVTREESRAHAADRVHDVVIPRRRGRAVASPVTPSTPPAGSALVASPAIWGTLAVAALMLAGSRTLPSNLAAGLSAGFQGGELRAIRADSTSVWHAWWDGWAGPGLGNADPASPALPGLAVLSWIAAHLPGDAGASPAGRVIAALMIAALPLAFLSAYAAGRVLTARRWPRAAAAAAWALSPVAIAAWAGGRLGGLAILVLLPLLLAAVITMTRVTARPGSLALAALVTTALACIVPGILALGVAIALALVLFGTGLARRRALGYLAVLALAAIPIVLLLRAGPAGLLGGWGMLAPAAAPPAWQLALGQPDLDPVGPALGGVTDYRVWLGAGILLAGLVGLARPRRRGGLSAAAAILALAGLAYAVLAPTLHLGADLAGSTIAPWPGGGLLLMTIGLLGAALLAADGDDPPGLDTETGAETEPPRRAGRTWRVGAGVLAAIGARACGAHLAYAGLGEQIRAAIDPRPAVAIDQAEGPLATRSLVLSVREGGTTYDLLGREPGLPARDLPLSAPTTTMRAPVAALIDPAQAGTGTDPARALAEWGVGFVIAERGIADEVLRQLDATAGLTRIGDHDGRAVWRVEPAGRDGREQPARVRVADAQNDWGTALPVAGAHAALRAPAPPGATALLIAQTPQWAQHARVSIDGTRLRPTTTAGGQLAYALPGGAEDIRIVVTPHHRNLGWAYLLTLLVLAYLATPIGAPPQRTTGRHAEENV